MDSIPIQKLSPEDQALIQDTIARYNRSIDTADTEEYLSVFTKDAIKENKSVWGTLRGRDEIAKAFERYNSAPVFASYRGGQHRVASTIYDSVGPGRVEAWSSYVFVIPSDAGPKILTMGTYRDIFVKENGRWLIAQRLITSDISVTPPS